MKRILLALLILVSFKATAQCDTVTNTTISNVTQTSAAISATLPIPTTYVTAYTVTYYKISGGAPFSTTNGTPNITLQNLTPATTYAVYITTHCGASKSQVGRYLFTTLGTTPTLNKYTRYNIYGWQVPRLQADSSFHLPRGDTSVRSDIRTPGMLAYKSSDNSIYYYDSTSWLPIGTSKNMANADLTITGNRTHNGNDKNFELLEARRFYVTTKDATARLMVDQDHARMWQDDVGPYVDVTSSMASIGGAEGDKRLELTSDSAAFIVDTKRVHVPKDGNASDTLATKSDVRKLDDNNVKIVDTKFKNGYAGYTLVNPNSFVLTQNTTGINVSGSTSTITNYLISPHQISGTQWFSKLSFKYNANGNGVSVGVTNEGNAYDGIVARASFAAGVATVVINRPNPLEQFAISTGTITLTPGDELVLMIRRYERFVYAALIKPSTGEVISTNHVFDISDEYLINRADYPFVAFTGGDFEIREHVYSLNNSPFKFALFGDSVSDAAYADNGSKPGSEYGSTYYQQLNKAIGGGANFSSGGNYSNNASDVVQYAKRLKPTFGIINVGLNDAINGRNTATYSMYVKEAIYNMAANDIVPILVTPDPWTVGATAINDTLVKYKNFINSLAGDYKVINTWDVLQSGNALLPGLDAGDGHPNAWGHNVIAKKILSELEPIFTDDFRYQNLKIGNYDGAASVSMFDLNNAGYTEVLSNKALVLRSAGEGGAHSVKILTTNGVAILQDTSYVTVDPQAKTMRFSNNGLSIVHRDLATVARFDSTGTFSVRNLPLTTPKDTLVYFDMADSIFKRTPFAITGSASLDFPNVNEGEYADLTFTVTGAAWADPVALGIPWDAMGFNYSFTAWVSAANTVTVRFHLLRDSNDGSSLSVDLAAKTFKIKVFK